MKFRLGQRIVWGERHWEVGAVLWLGERYYMLTRKIVDKKRDLSQTVSLIPEAVLERTGAKVIPPRLRAVPRQRDGLE